MPITPIAHTTIAPIETRQPEPAAATVAPTSLVAPDMPSSEHVAAVTGPRATAEPSDVKHAAIRTLKNNGYAGVATQLKEMKQLQMVARMGPEAAATLRAKIEVFEAMQGGAAGVQTALNHVIDTFSIGDAAKLDALVAVKNLFARFGALTQRMHDTTQTSREMKAEIAVYEAFYGGKTAIESAIEAPQLPVRRSEEQYRHVELVAFGCEAARCGKSGIVAAKKAEATLATSAMMTPEQSERAEDRRKLLDFLEETFAKIDH